MTTRYCIVGKPFTKQRVNGRKVRLRKKVHIERDGKTLCQTENGYRKREPRKQYVDEPGEPFLCKLCIGLLARHEQPPARTGWDDPAVVERALSRWASEAA